jgi:two-component system, OmpR family, phosphate regulon sensor histidine kinase PhoR
MRGKRTYQQRIFIYFLATFTLFILIILSFQFKREKNFRTAQLETRLDILTGLTSSYIDHFSMSYSEDFSGMDSLISFLPDKDVRITVIDLKGVVKYDNFVGDYLEMENHLMRPEIQKALYSETGSNIRHSETTGQDFYYYARNFENYFIRCAVVYNVEVKNFLKTERIFLFFMISLFIIVGGLLYLVTNRLGEFIKKLRDFAVRAGRNEAIDPKLELSDSEFGDIQNQIIQIYGSLKSAKDELTAEKERLYNHLVALNEGIAFFTPQKEKILANSNFIQYINMISDRSSISVDHFFEIEEMQVIIQQIDEKLSPDVMVSARSLPHFEHTLSKNEKYFKVQAIVFMDKSFEILISDITKPEKRRLLKQQLTSNIAHELKTPLASIYGYLETILNNKNLEKEKTRYFVKKAFTQSERLRVLLNDVSLLNNIEDAGDLYEFSRIKLKPLVDDIVENLEFRLKEKNINLILSVEPEVKVNGNDNLLSSIFQNLIENSINYAGEGIEINITQYLEDEKYYYFNYSDTGSGVAEEHLHRIFERFYRVDDGRTRKSGGTGLGLAIVKNAVQLHKGDISVRNRAEGGLEIIFSLSKY